MNNGKSKRLPVRKPVNGFALVATLTMMVLLMVLALGMLSLSSVSIRTSGRDRAAEAARQNARLALQLAIGELQTLAGPDNRVTASSSVAGKKDGGQEHLTGVWEGWKWKGEGSAPDWEKEKSQRFKGWLVSMNSFDSRLDPKFAEQALDGEKVLLASPPEDSKAGLEAQIVRVRSSNPKLNEGYAWAVSDESQKASVSVSAENKKETYSEKFDRMSSAHELGFKGVRAFDWKSLSEKKEQRSKLVTIGQSRLVGLKQKDVSFYDLTSGSLGLLTNVVEGGFAHDLSRLFDTEKLPAEFASRFIYSDKDTPLVAPPVRFKGANPFPSPDPSWALLQSHYRTYTKFSGSAPELTVSNATLANRPIGGAAVPSTQEILSADAFNKQQIAPVIAKAQFAFSLAFGYSDDLTAMYKDGRAMASPADKRDKYITWLVIDPVITLWNPYNVPIRFTSAKIELYRIPLAFRIYKNGTMVGDYTKLTDAHTVEDFKTRANRYYRLNIQPEKGQGSLLMQPGEHVVFTGHDWTLHGGQAYSTVGLTMRPGFNPPAGNSSSPEIGGVTTQNLFVDGTGSSAGKDYGKTVRTIAVKPGDQIQIEVKPDRAGADTVPEIGGGEITGFLKYYVGGLNASRRVGGIELDYGKDGEQKLLPHYAKEDLPTIVVSGGIPTADVAGVKPAEQALRWKEPFLISTFQQKTERDSRFPSRSWINNAPANLYASAGLDQKEDFAHQQYEFKWEPMTDWPPDSPTIEISNDHNRGYGGPGVYSQTGSEFATFASLPFAPAHSLGQLSHAPLNVGGQLPLTSQIVGNSYAPPLVSADKIREPIDSRVFLDHSYLANNALFDSWFLSTVADHPALSGGSARSASDLLQGFFTDDKLLPNSRFQPYLGSRKPKDLIDDLSKDPRAYEKIGAHMLVEAPFNVNSTSVAAWQAVLGANFGEAATLIDGQLDQSNGLPVMRNIPSVGGNFGAGGAGSDRTKWTGYRRLDDKQIEKLAKEIVEEVKKRGPFQSLAEFVNRRPGSGKLSESGALQAAIDRAGLNDEVLDSDHRFAGTTGANAAAGSGNTADGAPTVINQADLLTPIAPQLTVRGDTFKVRAYGEATGPDGEKVRAWCEAVVQRYPDYVDSTDTASILPESSINQTFGRRFKMVSFRWLSPSEI